MMCARIVECAHHHTLRDIPLRRQPADDEADEIDSWMYQSAALVCGVLPLRSSRENDFVSFPTDARDISQAHGAVAGRQRSAAALCPALKYILVHICSYLFPTTPKTRVRSFDERTFFFPSKLATSRKVTNNARDRRRRVPRRALAGARVARERERERERG